MPLIIFGWRARFCDSSGGEVPLYARCYTLAFSFIGRCFRIGVIARVANDYTGGLGFYESGVGFVVVHILTFSRFNLGILFWSARVVYFCCVYK